ncbi:hypothetical protein JXA85_00080 [Candidatus Woesearchaeota archaeon]|nr:hypothetical protein [Candidatus Woesearchaeota archaeon]
MKKIIEKSIYWLPRILAVLLIIYVVIKVARRISADFSWTSLLYLLLIIFLIVALLMTGRWEFTSGILFIIIAFLAISLIALFSIMFVLIGILLVINSVIHRKKGV